MAKLVKKYDNVFNKGAHSDDTVYEIMYQLGRISHKPRKEESNLVNNDIGELSYYTIYDKKFRIILYIEE